MKIAIIAPYADPECGAAVIRVNAFKDYFLEKDWKVSIFAPKRHGTGEANGVKRYGSVLDLFWILFSSDFKVVLGTSPPLTHNFFALLACKLSRKKFVLDAKDDPYVFEQMPSFFSVKGLKRRLYFLLRSLTYKNADLLFFLTDWDKKEAMERYKLKPEKCLLIPNGVDTSIVYFSAKARAETRAKLGIPENAKVLAYAGGIGDEEIPEMLKAIGCLEKEKIFLLMIVSVEKSQEQEFDSFLKKNQCTEKIKVVKNAAYQEISHYLSAADIGIVPWPEKYYTSLPVKVFDYLACGLYLAVKGPKKGALKEFFHRNPLAGDYAENWTDFKKNLNLAVSNINGVEKNRQKRIQIVEKKYDRKRFLEKAFLGIKGMVE
ncbi:MAG: glycosyltransferase [Candidatus Diapherotrites archaeon]